MPTRGWDVAATLGSPGVSERSLSPGVLQSPPEPQDEVSVRWGPPMVAPLPCGHLPGTESSGGPRCGGHNPAASQGCLPRMWDLRPARGAGGTPVASSKVVCWAGLSQGTLGIPRRGAGWCPSPAWLSHWLLSCRICFPIQVNRLPRETLLSVTLFAVPVPPPGSSSDANKQRRVPEALGWVTTPLFNFRQYVGCPAAMGTAGDHASIPRVGQEGPQRLGLAQGQHHCSSATLLPLQSSPRCRALTPPSPPGS